MASHKSVFENPETDSPALRTSGRFIQAARGEQLKFRVTSTESILTGMGRCPKQRGPASNRKRTSRPGANAEKYERKSMK